MEKIIILKKEDFEECLPSYVKKLFGKKLELTINKQLAKKIYFDYDCRFSIFIPSKLQEFIKTNFNEELKDWTDEFLLNKIVSLKECVEDPDYEFTRDIDNDLRIILDRYTENKDILTSIISIVELVCKKYGFRYALSEAIAHDSDFGPDHEAYEYLIGKSYHFYVSMGKNHIGFIQCLFNNGYIDLLKECIDRILVPCANSCFYDNKDYVSILPYAFFDVPRDCLAEMSEELAKYFESKVDERVKRAKEIISKTELTSPNHGLDITDIFVCKVLEKETIFSRLYKIGEDVCFTNLGFIKKPSDKIFLTDVMGITKNELSYEIVKKDSEMDIAIIKCDFSKIEWEVKCISPINKKLEIGDCIRISGDKARFNPFRFAPDLNLVQGFMGKANNKEIGDNEAINLVMRSIKNGTWESKYCYSCGFVTGITKNGYIVDAPFSKDIYDATAYTDGGKKVGIVKTLSENSDFVEIISFDSITELIDEANVY